MDIDKQGEERTEVEDGKDTNSMLFVNDCALFPMGNNHHQDMNSLEKTCEIPEKIRTLHQLTLQNIDHVKFEFASLFSPRNCKLSNGSTSCGQPPVPFSHNHN